VNNLSEVTETVLADFLAADKQRRAAEVQLVRATVETWNRFAEKHGSVADEHSTL
jgi:hypothetical protein